MNTLICAECGEKVYPDEDHVKVDAEWKHIDDRNTVDEYFLHFDCAFSVFDEWGEP